jgi:spermidine synthase
MAAHVPMLYHPAPKQVLTIGLGAGQTCSRFLMYDIERLDCVDIESRLPGLLREHFDGAWMDDPRVRLIVEDGRNFLTHADQRYDVISMELGQIFRPGVASFYTADYYERISSRLQPGGVVCQFIPILGLDTYEFRRLIATFIDTFPRSALWYNTGELLLVGAIDHDLKLSEARLTLLETNALVREDTRYAHWGGPAQWLNQPEVLLGSFLAGPSGLSRLVQQAPPYRDDRPELEYRGHKRRSGGEVQIVEVIRPHLDPVEEALSAELGPPALRVARATRRSNLNDIVAMSWTTRARQHGPQSGEGLRLLRRALEGNPGSARLNSMVGHAYRARGEPGLAARYFATAVEIDPGNARWRTDLGSLLAETGRLFEAEAQLAEAVRLKPDSALAHYNLGMLLAGQARFDEAISHFRRTLEIDPELDDARSALRAALARSK